MPDTSQRDGKPTPWFDIQVAVDDMRQEGVVTSRCAQTVKAFIGRHINVSSTITPVPIPQSDGSLVLRLESEIDPNRRVDIPFNENGILGHITFEL